MRHIRTFLTISYLIFGTALFGGLCWLAGLVQGPTGNGWWFFAQIWAKGLIKIGGIRGIHILGEEKISLPQAHVVMANHQSHFDVPLLISQSKAPLRFVAKHSLFYFPIFGWALKATGHIPVNRKKREQAIKSLDNAASLIASGRNVLVFPEGTRSDAPELLPFKKGAFVLAIKSGVPIIPVGISGTDDIVPPKKFCNKVGPVTIIVGKPIETASHTVENKEKLIHEVRESIEELKRMADQHQQNL